MYSKKGQGRSAENHYHTMNIDDIRSLPVADIADDDCVLFLWITFPCLKEGISVMESWGFTYKTCGFNWVKRNKKKDTYFMGLGFWTRSNSEVCLIGTKGHPKRVSKAVSQICDARVMAVSYTHLYSVFQIPKDTDFSTFWSNCIFNSQWKQNGKPYGGFICKVLFINCV